MCLCVCQTTHCGHARIPQNTVADSSIQTGTGASTTRRYSCMHTHCKHLCFHFFSSFPLFSRARNKNGTQMRAQTAHTGLFFPSQLCSDIKQSPLRENKHADEERLAGHTVWRCMQTHTETNAHINACAGSVWTLSDCQRCGK